MTFQQLFGILVKREKIILPNTYKLAGLYMTLDVALRAIALIN